VKGQRSYTSSAPGAACAKAIGDRGTDAVGRTAIPEFAARAGVSAPRPSGVDNDGDGKAGSNVLGGSVVGGRPARELGAGPTGTPMVRGQKRYATRLTDSI